MKKLMMTTAIVAVTSLGAVAQTTDTTTDQTQQQQQDQAQQQQQMVPAFLATDFTGKDLYTVDVDEARQLRDQHQQQDRGWERTQMRWESGQTFGAQRDRWENVGSIDDIVMTGDGEIRGVLIDVGGFLGIGARTVMVDLDHLYFVRDQDGGDGWFTDTADDFFIVAAMTEAELESLPEFDEDQLRAGLERRAYDDRRQEPGAMMGHDGEVAAQEGRDAEVTEQQAMQDDPATEDEVAMQDDQAAQQEQAMQDDQAMQGDRQARTQAPEGYQMMADEQRTADNLMGADVYDGENQQIGSVEDIVLDGNEISHLVLDIGGFLGIGEHRIALSMQEVDIFWSDQDDEVRVQVPMTQEELEQMPEYDS
jgi:sporulation protein YlmC with PRC-barrel domain